MPDLPLCPKCRKPLTDYCDWCIECIVRPCMDCGEATGALLATTCMSCAVKRESAGLYGERVPSVDTGYRAPTVPDDEEFSW